ncbi:hypothetical protein FIBSPDRAFT_1047781 [Athelia psychrophila]|uniref:Uncharacterized protein n=1 Tax=Athelia psychrophila TaxID=1759441 RepID=A0A166EQ20_9AGAM|nr:hypothetical protein FIBSPDRAFT_1047781 [Fibularhizoctonia sp. CBS 109695]
MPKCPRNLTVDMSLAANSKPSSAEELPDWLAGANGNESVKLATLEVHRPFAIDISARAPAYAASPILLLSHGSNASSVRSASPRASARSLVFSRTYALESDSSEARPHGYPHTRNQRNSHKGARAAFISLVLSRGLDHDRTPPAR